jgi:cytoskeletal protein CcmA (bactofilin family)
VAGVAGGPTYFDEASEFSGTLRLQKSATIDGHIEGEIDCEQSVTVGPSGSVSARVRAESVVIHGEVHGDIEARSEITLHKTARVHGDMSTQGIVIEKGAQVEGRITIGTANAAARLPAPSTPLEMGTGSGTDRSQEAHKSQG